MAERLLRLVFGAPPRQDASRLELLVWIRYACYRRLLPLYLVVWLAPLVTGAPLVVVIPAEATFVIWFVGVVYGSVLIARERGPTSRRRC